MHQTHANGIAGQPQAAPASIRRIGLVILGMHRSGTSALAGMLQILGCDQPATLMVPTKDNEKGYFESLRIYPFHTRLLASAASSWNDWLPINPGWFQSPRADEFREEAVTIMGEEFAKSRLFVLKDPRICRLVPFWETVMSDIGAEPRYILTHRNPLEVAASLEKRDGLAREIGLLTWLRHMLDAEAGTRGRPRTFTNFAQLMENWAGVAQKIQDDLDVTLPRLSLSVAPEMEEFLSEGLRHHVQNRDRVLKNPLLSDWVRNTYDIFERWAETGEDPVDYQTLNEISAAMTVSASAFSGIVRAAEQGTRMVRDQKAEIDQLNEARASAEQRLESTQSEAAELRAETARLDKENKNLVDQLAHVRSALEQRSHEADETRKELDRLRAEDTTRQAQMDDLAASFQAREKLLHERLDEANRKLAMREAEVGTQNRELSEITKILADTEHAAKLEQCRAEKAEYATMALKTSISWRLTAPLRKVSGLIRRRRS
ncbi:hypothetical protein EV663_1281 [Rhodovulum bhavnagarense]|uniref:Sulfotransferase family protein n=1 Tax=Rhodovulum bhavnagarense TaxID=992286 RepID=A0A4R2R8Z6_9RHOB|nr:hypothetical protein [Rhodovulum bhavnagarense]TCP58407.1 hypothetical protein EV663_1281 [Rhodovulum bhavnagarense]